MMFSTLDAITKKLGIKLTEPALGSFPAGTKYTPAPEVEEIAKQLIDKFRPELSGWKIAYVFKATASKSKEGEILGQARRDNDLSRLLHGFDGMVIIAFDKWVSMDDDQKARLTFHELEHFAPNIEKSCLDIIEHPINEFPSVIKIFGPGQESDISFIEAYQSFCKDNSTAIDEIQEQRKKTAALDTDDE